MSLGALGLKVLGVGLIVYAWEFRASSLTA